MLDFVDADPANRAKNNSFKRALVIPSRNERDRLKQRAMKRFGDLYSKILCMENLRAADLIAQRGKSRQRDVIRHNSQAETNLQQLQQLLITEKFKTSPYHRFTIHDPKQREIFSLPYFPDRILHHAIMNVLEPVFISTYTADSYSCIKGRGVHLAIRKMKAAMKDSAGTRYCLKLDIRKFYPSVNHQVLKQQLRRKFKDVRLLGLLDGIIDSCEGLPIGNYLSQFFANYYLTGFDHWLKEKKKVKYYFRYADDLVIFSDSKTYLHQLLAQIRCRLYSQLRLELNGNYQVFPVAARGVDFLGYRSYHTHTLLRKRVKKAFAKAVAAQKQASLASYMGWASHCNSRNLIKKLTKNIAA
jgi:RNA-directed DNA polymerase